MNKAILTSSEVAGVISTLTQSLAYVQEITIVGKLDDNDLGSPIVPKYTSKQRVLEGKLRDAAEAKLLEYINTL